MKKSSAEIKVTHMFVMFNCFKKNICKLLVAIFLVLGLFIYNLVLAMEYGGFGGRPANPDPTNPRTESIFIYNLNPGDTKEDEVLVVNNSKEKKTLLVYGVDGRIGSDGGFGCSQLLDVQKNVGTWIKMSKTEVTLDPGKNEIVSFKVTVPKNTNIGEQNGCMMVEEKKEEKPDPNKAGMQIGFRTGMRMVITIPGEIVRKLEIVGFEVSPAKNDTSNYILHPLVKNLGNVSIDADIKVKTKNIFGVTVAENGGQFAVMRDSTTDWNFKLKRPFWGGWYKSALIVEYDADKEAGVGKRTGKEMTKLERPAIWFFVMPQTKGLIVQGMIVFFILFAGFLYWFYQERRKWVAKSWVEYEVKQGDDIKSLAKKFDVSWKLLTSVNKLKAPYVLDINDKIKVPPLDNVKDKDIKKEK